MISTARGCDDGYTRKVYEAGEEYDLGESLASSFITFGTAKAATEPKKRSDKSRKAKENKSESSISSEGNRDATDGGGNEEASSASRKRER